MPNLIAWERRRGTVIAKRADRDGKPVSGFVTHIQRPDETVFLISDTIAARGGLLSSRDFRCEMLLRSDRYFAHAAIKEMHPP